MSCWLTSLLCRSVCISAVFDVPALATAVAAYEVYDWARAHWSLGLSRAVAMATCRDLGIVEGLQGLLACLVC